MSVFQRVRMPSLDGATGWVKSDPLGPAELRGHVVLVNFWTLTCINWLRHEPYVRAWSQAYRDDERVRERTLEITFLEPGAEAYSFTFG
jgi:hypothetical protein